MNKRICFAGFNGQETSIMEAAAGNVRTWECAFTTDGPETLAELSAEHFDAVVAHLDTGGLRGDEILQQAAKLQPEALRFIVGDSGDTSIIFSCVKDGNNFIASDSTADELLSAVQRGFDLDAQVASEDFARSTAAQSRITTPVSSSRITTVSKTDWTLRILIPTAIAATIVALAVWWNRAPAEDRVLRVKAIANETPAPAPATPPSATTPSSSAPQPSDGAASLAAPEGTATSLAETKVK